MRGDQSQASLPWSSPVLHPAELPLPWELLAQHSQRGAHSTFQTFPSHVVELCLTPALWLRQRRWGALPLHRDGAGTPLPYPPCPGPPWGPPHEAPFSHPFWVQVFGVPWSSRAFHFGMQPMGRRKHTACGSSLVGAGTGDHPWGAPGASCHPTGHPPTPGTPGQASSTREVPGQLQSTRAKAVDSGDLSLSRRVPTGMKGRCVPRTSPALAGPWRAGGGVGGTDRRCSRPWHLAQSCSHSPAGCWCQQDEGCGVLGLSCGQLC